MYSVAWSDCTASAKPVVLDLEEVEQVSGGNPVAAAAAVVAAAGAGYTAGYNSGRDRANRDNRRDRNRRRP